MKTWVIILSIMILAALLIPFPAQLKDGGTVHYDAILYDVYDVHRIKPVDNPSEDETIETEYIEGVIIDTDDGDFWNILVEFDDDVVGAWNNQCWCNGRHLDLVPEEAIDEVKLSFSELMSV